MPDLLVVGAGPAGAAAALTAHTRGLDVVVIDKATFPRDKTCGDGLTASALRLLEGLGIETPSVPGYLTIDETVLVSPSGHEVVLPLPDDGAHSAVVPRADLDAALVARIRATGIELLEACTATQLQPGADGAQVTLSEGRVLTARWVIAADGHFSSVRRMLDPTDGPDLGTWHAVRQYFSGVTERRQWVLFDRDLLPGYVWMFPLPGDRANVGFGVLRGDQRGTGKEMAARWRDVLDRPRLREVLGPDAEPEGPHKAWPIPAAYTKDRLVEHGAPVLYTGDAAAVVDPMTGEGIAQALETGILAAECIARGDTADHVRARYQHGVDRALGRDLRFATALQRVLRSPVGARAAIRAAGLTDWTRRCFARWMFEDYPRALLLTPDRWHRGVFTAPGAYRAA
jgi:geranylgeranyl reductase family protein